MEQLNDIQALALYIAIAAVAIIGILALITAPLHPAAILVLIRSDRS